MSRTSLKLSISCKQREQQQHRQERDDDVHRRTLSEIMASRRGAVTVLERDGAAERQRHVLVRQHGEPEIDLAAEARPRFVARSSLSRLVARPVANTAGRSQVA